MNVAMRKVWTREAFFAWAEAQEGRWEFDGVRPVGMTGGSLRHSEIAGNILVSLKTRLRGGVCRALGPDAAVATSENAVRYPDVVVTCTKYDGKALVTPGPVSVFEVISPSPSPSSGKLDRFDKVLEYGGVDTIRRYVIVESEFVGVMVLERGGVGEAWRTVMLGEDGVLVMKEIGVEVAVAEFYEGVAFGDVPELAPVGAKGVDGRVEPGLDEP